MQGLVIAGGGAKASFQIGALRYLYEREHIAPSVITATSAGSILGALLAQTKDPAKQLEYLKSIEKLWLSMQTSSDMFAERRWFTRLKSHTDALETLRQLEAQNQTTPSSAQADSQRRTGFRLWPSRHVDTATDQPDTAGNSPASEQSDTTTPDADELEPQLATLALAMQEEPAAAMELTPAMFYQLATGLPRFGRMGSDLTKAINGLERNRSLYKPGPILEKLLSRDFFHAEDVTSSGMTLRCAFVGLNSGELHYMREDGIIVNRDDEPVGGPALNITMGVLSSCSIPGVFKPVHMNDEWYVDGGIRENVPVEAAVANLGVTQPYVIVSGPPGVGTADVGHGDIISLLFRVSAIRGDESERDEVAYARSTGAVVIEPEITVHDSMSIDPGLLEINRDYGWMRAAEAVLEPGAEAEQIDREIIQARLRAWRLEKAMLQLGTKPAASEVAAELHDTKESLRTLIAQADPRVLPHGTDRWWREAEKHARNAE